MVGFLLGAERFCAQPTFLIFHLCAFTIRGAGLSGTPYGGHGLRGANGATRACREGDACADAMRYAVGVKLCATLRKHDRHTRLFGKQQLCGGSVLLCSAPVARRTAQGACFKGHHARAVRRTRVQAACGALRQTPACPLLPDAHTSTLHMVPVAFLFGTIRWAPNCVG